MNVSIIVATYGEDSWEDLALKRAVPSAASQDAFEVLHGHDPDGTIAGVRNALAANAEGDWLCFLDADDELAPGYLDAMERALAREREYARPEQLLLTPGVMTVRKGRHRRHFGFYPEVDLLKANWLVVGTLITRDLFERIGGFSDYPHGFEDWSAWYKATRLGARVVKVPKALYVQHVNTNSKHRQGWRDRKWQVATHQRVQKELEAWTP